MSKIDQEIRICFTVTLVCTHFAKFLIFNFLKGLTYSALVEDGVGENDDIDDDDVSGNFLTVTTLEHQQAKETSPRELFSKSEDVHRGPGALCLCIEQHDPGLLYASLC